MERVQVWRAGDVASLYGVDESTVHRWERSGRLRRARRDPGGSKYWLRHELLADLADEPDRHGELLDVGELAQATRRRRHRRAS